MSMGLVSSRLGQFKKNTKVRKSPTAELIAACMADFTGTSFLSV